jgi:hypothetical protein
MREIVNVEGLRFPALDAEKVAEVLRLFPDTIHVNGRDWSIEYRSGYEPRIRLDSTQLDAGAWRHLPDEPFALVNGKVLEIVLDYGYWDTHSHTQPTILKELARQKANSAIWDQWCDKPGIPLPNPEEHGEFPEIITAEYGRCVLTGQPLVAYGTPVLNKRRWYESDPLFQGEWFRTRQEAIAKKRDAVAEFDKLAKQYRPLREKVTAMNQARVLQIRLQVLLNEHETDSRLAGDLKDRLRKRAKVMLGTDEQMNQKFCEIAEKLISAIETALAEAPEPACKPVSNLPIPVAMEKTEPVSSPLKPQAITPPTPVKPVKADLNKLFGGNAKVR